MANIKKIVIAGLLGVGMAVGVSTTAGARQASFPSEVPSGTAYNSLANLDFEVEGFSQRPMVADATRKVTLSAQDGYGVFVFNLKGRVRERGQVVIGSDSFRIVYESGDSPLGFEARQSHAVAVDEKWLVPQSGERGVWSKSATEGPINVQVGVILPLGVRNVRLEVPGSLGGAFNLPGAAS